MCSMYSLGELRDTFVRKSLMPLECFTQHFKTEVLLVYTLNSIKDKHLGGSFSPVPHWMKPLLPLQILVFTNIQRFGGILSHEDFNSNRNLSKLLYKSIAVQNAGKTMGFVDERGTIHNS